MERLPRRRKQNERGKKRGEGKKEREYGGQVGGRERKTIFQLRKGPRHANILEGREQGIEEPNLRSNLLVRAPATIS